MVEITVAYDGKLHCTATHGPSGSCCHTDAPADNGGQATTFSPTDMMATALGTCIATTMALYGERNNLDLTGVRVRVVKEMSSDPPRRIVRLAADVFMPMPRLAMHAEKLERVARGCPVHQSLHPMIDKPVRFHWET